MWEREFFLEIPAYRYVGRKLEVFCMFQTFFSSEWLSFPTKNLTKDIFASDTQHLISPPQKKG